MWPDVSLSVSLSDTHALAVPLPPCLQSASIMAADMASRSPADDSSVRLLHIMSIMLVTRHIRFVTHGLGLLTNQQITTGKLTVNTMFTSQHRCRWLPAKSYSLTKGRQPMWTEPTPSSLEEVVRSTIKSSSLEVVVRYGGWCTRAVAVKGTRPWSVEFFFSFLFLLKKGWDNIPHSGDFFFFGAGCYNFNL